MERYICIHGHFYQPPRENPWLEAIEIHDSAHPYHNWNERITAECYAPNSASRILDGENRIMDIASNYARISFNFGPTLLSWMETYSPETYQAILEADKQSIEWRSGHGNMISQVYNHLIMPLANRRDKRTQVIWGIKDFEHRVKRLPEGVDSVTLEFITRKRVEEIMESFFKNPSDSSQVQEAEKWLTVLNSLPFEVDLWHAQNIYYRMSKTVYREFLQRIQSGDEDALRWVEEFKKVGQEIFFNIRAILGEQ